MKLKKNAKNCNNSNTVTEKILKIKSRLSLKRNKEQTIWHALIYLLFSFLTMLFITVLCPLGQTISIQQKFAIILNNTIILYVSGSILLLLKRGNFLFALYNILWVMLSLANALVFKCRGTSLTKYDFLMIKEGVNLSRDFLYRNDYIKIVAILLVLASILFVSFKLSKKYKRLSLENWIITLLVSYSIFKIAPVSFIDKDVDKIGFVNYMSNNLISSDIKKLENYNKSTMKSIKDKFKNPKEITEGNNIKPNIIAVQLESFFDPKDIKGLKLSENPLPYFDSLKKDFSHGYVDVPVFGGGTALSEFEFLSGMDSSMFAKGSIPHNTFLKSKSVTTIPYILRDMGYKTHLLHNYLGDFYNRCEIYKNLGFDTFSSKELIYYSAWDKHLIKASKDSIFGDEISNIITKNEDTDFIFSITSQLHGPYYKTYTPPKDGIKATGSIAEKYPGEINEYVNTLKAVDEAIENIVKKVEESNEPSIIIFYSDHLPSLEFKDTNLEKQKYKTPYLVWDNIGLDKEIKNMDLSDLLVDTLNKANINIGYLSNLRSEYNNKNIKEKEYNNLKNLINYDISFGENYLKEKQYEKLNTKIGYRDLQIESSTKTGVNEYTVKGWNYTEYVQLVCDNKAYDIEYGGPGEIKVITDDDLLNKDCYLKIDLNGRNTSVSVSNIFQFTN